MRNQLVYDWPLRFFHWLFAFLFVSVFFIAKTVDDESFVFAYHMIGGIMMVFLVFLRILWGVFGSKYSRFSSFSLKPKNLARYFIGILTGDKKVWVGHNPASSWAALGMFSFAIGLGFTGYLMVSGDKEVFEEIHELLAHGFLVVVLLHVAGILLHSWMYKDGMAFSMMDGNKRDVQPLEMIPSSKLGTGLGFLVVVALAGSFLLTNFDSQRQNLNLFGTSLQLGEEQIEGKSRPAESESESLPPHGR